MIHFDKQIRHKVVATLAMILSESDLSLMCRVDVVAKIKLSQQQSARVPICDMTRDARESIGAHVLHMAVDLIGQVSSMFEHLSSPKRRRKHLDGVTRYSTGHMESTAFPAWIGTTPRFETVL